ncbi:MAG: Na+/H+ antiporter NhaA [Clostridium butyricum]|nr:Na+/H+ antiporter NhaA [Clostridium butyricum]
MILKYKLNPLLKIFLLSLAVVDDLISILVIGILYSSHINVWCLLISVIILLILLAINRNEVDNIASYLLVGLVLCFFIYYSGVHATISEVSLASAIPSNMSIFVSEIAFDNNSEFINISKISILASAIISIVITYIVATLINFYQNKHKSKPNYHK